MIDPDDPALDEMLACPTCSRTVAASELCECDQPECPVCHYREHVDLFGGDAA